MNQTWLPSQTGPIVFRRHAPLRVVARNEGMQHGDAKVEAVQDGEADEQDAENRPPDEAKRHIVEHRFRLSYRVCAGAGAGSTGAPERCGSASSRGPMRTYLTISATSMMASAL